ncbi:MAG: thymidine phosphorylase [Armatimonadota bacterium]|nr:thymidine phosphorylase [Armatimonadota bacterium]
MTAREFIRTKRNGQAHSPAEIRWFVNAFVAKEIADYQVSAWLMAAVLNGLQDEETTALTLAMAESGQTLSFPSLGTVVDKHSTGGVGDVVTPLFIPIVAACGVKVFKMSGRGLGFTGGTLDKLESIPGFRGDLSPDQLVAQAERIGCAWGGQAADLAPADKILYALRDATETVESLPLIAASIMSKKLAAGADVIVLDVKCGNGAFMKSPEDARALATALTSIAHAAGRKAKALITGMSQPLAPAVGNALELKAAFAELHSGMRGRLGQVTMALAEAACSLAGSSISPREAVDNGAAEAKLREWIDAQGGDPRVVDDPSLLPSAPLVYEVKADRSGYVSAIDCRALGEAARALGAGRIAKNDAIDHAVGIEVLFEIGDKVEAGQPVFAVHCKAQQPTDLIGTIEIIPEDPTLPPLIALN